MRYIRKGGGTCSDWVIGISKEPRIRLFNGHGVHERGDLWIYRTAQTYEAARDIESYFVNSLGTEGGIGEGGQDSHHVYAYKKSPHTAP
jgi:hypothetical protein